MLNCNVHPCPSKCHQLYDHSKSLCQEWIFGKCAANIHKASWKCHQGPRATCNPCAREAERIQEQLLHDALLQERRDADQAVHDDRMAEMETKLKVEIEVIADANTVKQREAMVKQKEREIQEAKVRAQKATGSPKEAGRDASQATSSLQQPSDPSSTPSQSPGIQQSSAARDEWESQKKLLGEQNDAIDSIMAMTGLEAVKSQVLQTKEKLDLMKRQGVPANKERLNLALLGNPGTGACSGLLRKIYLTVPQGRRRFPGYTPSFSSRYRYFRGMHSRKQQERLWHMMALGVQRSLSKML